MSYSASLKRVLMVVFACLALTACATQTKVEVGGQIQGDVYTGLDTVEYMAT